MNINGNELRKNDAIILDGKLYVCMSAEHRTPGNLKAYMIAKLRDVKSGLQRDAKFMASERIEKVDLYTKKMQFLYRDGEVFHFMDTKDFEQFEIPVSFIGDNDVFLKEEMVIDITFHEETPVAVEYPQSMDFTVVETEPEVKNATATSSYKSAKLDNGIEIKVPPFIKQGERVKVKIETREYMERVKD